MSKGIVYIIISGLSFLVVNFFVKIFGLGPENGLIEHIQKIPAHELVLARSLVSLSISYFIIFRKGLPLLGNNKKWLFIRGISGTIALTIFFQSIQNLPISIAATIQYLAPIFTMVFAIIILGERIQKLQWIFVALAFFGVTLITLNDYFASYNGIALNYFWVSMGIISASMSGIAYVAIVKLKSTDSPISVVGYFPLIAAPIMIVWCFFDFVMPSGIEWLILLVIGVFTQIAQVTLTMALQIEQSSKIIPFQYLGSVYALLVGYLVLDEKLNTVVVIGVVLILLGVTLNSLIRKRNTSL